MKNLFKFGFLALAISLSVAACSSNKTEEATDTTNVAPDTTAAAGDTTAAAGDTTAAN